MNKQKDRRDVTPNDLPEEEYRPDINKGTACFLVGIAAALAGDTALYFRWYALGLLFYVILLICVVWIVKERKNKDRNDYRRYRKISEALNQIENFDKRLDTLETNLDLKADRPARSNIRPGSRQSEQYKVLIGGAEHDSRTED